MTAAETIEFFTGLGILDKVVTNKVGDPVLILGWTGSKTAERCMTAFRESDGYHVSQELVYGITSDGVHVVVGY